MSRKRIATSDLNHKNWDQEEEAEDAGKFSAAPQSELRNRPMKQATRRQRPSPDDGSDRDASLDSRDEEGGKNTSSVFGSLNNLAGPAAHNPARSFFQPSSLSSKSNLQFFKVSSTDEIPKFGNVPSLREQTGDKKPFFSSLQVEESTSSVDKGLHTEAKAGAQADSLFTATSPSNVGSSKAVLDQDPKVIVESSGDGVSRNGGSSVPLPSGDFAKSCGQGFFLPTTLVTGRLDDRVSRHNQAAQGVPPDATNLSNGATRTNQKPFETPSFFSRTLQRGSDSLVNGCGGAACNATPDRDVCWKPLGTTASRDAPSRERRDLVAHEAFGNCLPLGDVTPTQNFAIIANAAKHRDSRLLLKPVPADVKTTLAAKSKDGGKSLHFLERTYQLNMTTIDWLRILVDRDLTINIADVMPSYIQELLKLVAQEKASQESQDVVVDLSYVQAKLNIYLDGLLGRRPTSNGTEATSSALADAVSHTNGGPEDHSSLSNGIDTEGVPLAPTLWKGAAPSLSQGAASTFKGPSPAQSQGAEPTFKGPAPSLSQGAALTFKGPTPSPSQGAEPTFKGPAPAEPSQSEEPQTNDEDEPPKATFTPVVEEGHSFTLRCKVFIKKSDPKDPDDTSYQERGVGTLFLKPIASGRVQLIVRADTSLGNLLVNASVSASTPVQKANKNSVLVVCVPTADETRPRTVLLRVKTPEDADRLVEKLKDV